MAIIKEFYSGHTHITIHDDYAVNTPEVRERALDNIAKIWAEDELKHLMQENTEKSEPA